MVEIIVAFIGFVGVIAAQSFQSRKQHGLLEEKLNSLEEKVDLKIDNLSKDVQKHNNVIERTYELEKQVAIIQGSLR